MKYFTFLLLLLPFISFSQVTRSINFNHDSLWISGTNNAGSAVSLTAYGSHSYNDTLNHFFYTSYDAYRENMNNGLVDGVDPVMLGAGYAIRVRNASGSFAQFRIAQGGVSTFSFMARRWDATPEVNANIAYSIDGGSNWIILDTFNHAKFNNSSAYKLFTYTLNSSVPNLLIQVNQLGTSSSNTERMMIDDFTWTSMPTCPTVAPTASAVSACFGQNATATATDLVGGVLNWYDASSGGNLIGTGPTHTLNNLTANTSIWVEEFVNNCPASPRTEVAVTVNALPVVNAGVDQAICVGSQVTLTATGATTYSWDNNVQNGVPFTVNTTTTYVVIGTTNGCSANDTVVVVVNAEPVVTVVNNNNTLEATSVNAVSYQWINCADNSDIAGATSATYAPTVNGSYSVRVINVEGCSKVSNCVSTTLGVDVTESLSVSINPNPSTGKFVLNTTSTDKFDVVIYNSLGQQILVAKQVSNGYSVNLENANNGVYMIKLNSNNKSGVYRIVKN